MYYPTSPQHPLEAFYPWSCTPSSLTKILAFGEEVPSTGKQDPHRVEEIHDEIIEVTRFSQKFDPARDRQK